jgi:hypothetical protein
MRSVLDRKRNGTGGCAVTEYARTLLDEESVLKLIETDGGDIPRMCNILLAWLQRHLIDLT